MKGLPGKKKQKQNKKMERKKPPQKPTYPQLMAPPFEREEDHRLTDTEIIKVDTTFCKVIGPCAHSQCKGNHAG